MSVILALAPIVLSVHSLAALKYGSVNIKKKRYLEAEIIGLGRKLNYTLY